MTISLVIVILPDSDSASSHPSDVTGLRNDPTANKILYELFIQLQVRGYLTIRLQLRRCIRPPNEKPQCLHACVFVKLFKLRVGLMSSSQALWRQRLISARMEESNQLSGRQIFRPILMQAVSLLISFILDIG
jgi:hypothetical protein